MTATAREMAPAVGAVGLLRSSDGLRFSVRILDVKTEWGDVRFLVVPVAGGERSVWVSASRVVFPESTGERLKLSGGVQ